MWQPIEIVPHDGSSNYLLCLELPDGDEQDGAYEAIDDYERGCITIGWFDTTDGVWLEWFINPMANEDDDFIGDHRIIYPTHWMTLPDPPKGA